MFKKLRGEISIYNLLVVCCVGILIIAFTVVGIGTITGSNPEAGSSFYTTIQNEGSDLTQRVKLNCVGEGVTCSDDAGGNRTLITISGGGSGIPDDGWVAADAMTYVSDYEVTVAGDQTAKYSVGMKIRLVNDSITKWFTLIKTPTFGGGETTLTFDDWNESVVAGAITSPFYSVVQNPVAFGGFVQQVCLADPGCTFLVEDSTVSSGGSIYMQAGTGNGAGQGGSFTGKGGSSSTASDSNSGAASLQAGSCQATNCNGGSIAVQAANANGTGNGGAVYISAGGNGNDNGTTGFITIDAGDSYLDSTSSGGDIYIRGGSSYSGIGGVLYLIGGPSNSIGQGGNIQLTSGSGGTSNGNAGTIFVTGGGAFTGTGGGITIATGEASVDGAGGTLILSVAPSKGNLDGSNIQMYSGVGGDLGGNGGGIILTAGSANPTPIADSQGGQIYMLAGNGNDNGAGGNASLSAGDGGATAAGGFTIIKGGRGKDGSAILGGSITLYGGESTGIGGDVNVTGGGTDDATQAGGDVYITGGYPTGGGTGTGGSVYIIGQASSGGNSGFVSISSVDAFTGDTSSGAITLLTGNGSGLGNPGNLVLTGGNSSGDSGGNILITSGNGTGNNARGGLLKLKTGTADGSGLKAPVSIDGNANTPTTTQLDDGFVGFVTNGGSVFLYTNHGGTIKSTKVGLLTVGGGQLATSTNCQSSSGTCGDAAAGSVSIAAAATTITVSTTAVTATSQILIQEDATLGGNLSVTCNTTIARSYQVTTRTAGTSFVITASAAPITNPACLHYLIVN